MIKVIVNGAQGKMGKAAVQAIENDEALTCIAECDVNCDLNYVIPILVQNMLLLRWTGYIHYKVSNFLCSFLRYFSEQIL